MILYGASGHAKVIIEILEQQGIPVIGLVDANPAVQTLLGYKVYQSLINLDADEHVIIAIGNNAVRKKISVDVEQGFGTAVHPSANISSRAEIGEGTVVMASVSVNSSTVVGKHVILNTNCSVDHDGAIGNYVHISPNAALAGNVTVGEGTHIGMGASVVQGINIGKWATIGAGAVIINDVPDNAVIVGNPGRIIRYNK